MDRQLARYEIVRVYPEMLCWLASDSGEFEDDGSNSHKMERANSLDQSETMPKTTRYNVSHLDVGLR